MILRVYCIEMDECRRKRQKKRKKRKKRMEESKVKKEMQRKKMVKWRCSALLNNHRIQILANKVED